MIKQRYYHRFVRDEDLDELEAASSYLFAFEPHEVTLRDVINSDRWFCLAAVSSTSSGEKIVGFVAAALGAVKEFPQERQHLEAALAAANSSAASNDTHSTAAAAATASASQQITVPATAAEAHAFSDNSSSSSSNALAVEVVLLGVIPEFRRTGVASRLLKQVRTHARTKGASLLFLHVQTTNTPARQLYQKFGFTSAAVLPGYYSFRQGLNTQQQQQQESAAAAAAVSVWGSQDFSGTDAELLVMHVSKNAIQSTADMATVPAAVGATSNAATHAVPAAATTQSSSSSRSNSDSRQRADSRQQDSSDSTDTNPGAAAASITDTIATPPPPAAAVATEAVTAAAAAAARLLLGPAIGFLGLTGRGSSSSRQGVRYLGKRGELVPVGDGEYLVQVREGSDVFVYDPDDVPDNVVLSDRDKALLQQQQRQQQEEDTRVGDDDAHDEDSDDDDQHGSGGGMMKYSSSVNTQQQQQRSEVSAGTQQQQQQQHNHQLYAPSEATEHVLYSLQSWQQSGRSLLRSDAAMSGRQYPRIEHLPDRQISHHLPQSPSSRPSAALAAAAVPCTAHHTPRVPAAGAAVVVRRVQQNRSMMPQGSLCMPHISR